MSKPMLALKVRLETVPARHAESRLRLVMTLLAEQASPHTQSGAPASTPPARQARTHQGGQK